MRCAAWLASAAEAGWLVFLDGDLGAGKTAFARGFIRALCGQGTQVPSPSFTLVQPYQDATPPILHSDFYRLADAEEVLQLGLVEALADHCVLVEWAERADDLLPPPTVIIALKEDTTAARHITITAPSDVVAGLEKAAARDADIAGFLRTAGWAEAERHPLAGDASTRRYERLKQNDQSAVLMDWLARPDGPAVYDGKPYSAVVHLAEAMPAYCRMVDWLRAHDIAAPALLARDQAAGFALMADFGDRHIANDATIDRSVFYHEAIANLLHLHQVEAAPFLAAYDGAVQAIEASLFIDWYMPFIGSTLEAKARAAFDGFWQRAGDALVGHHPVTVLRDYHSVNLLWRETAQARYRIGVIDVQDALAGHAAYDVASLLADARLDVDPAHAAAAYQHYVTARFGDDRAAQDEFAAAYAHCLVQRNLKIAGIFVRLAQRDGKTGYLKHLPRILRYLRHGLAHPALAEMADWMRAHAPGIMEPSDESPN
ncbi:MAG: tRNA (adenosine(37)-N6)-threonylcarbamoyltransferase complex ATPase subunit type 1 TsaE [Parvibaculales bacterium]